MAADSLYVTAETLCVEQVFLRLVMGLMVLYAYNECGKYCVAIFSIKLNQVLIRSTDFPYLLKRIHCLLIVMADQDLNSLIN